MDPHRQPRPPGDPLPDAFRRASTTWRTTARAGGSLALRPDPLPPLLALPGDARLPEGPPRPGANRRHRGGGRGEPPMCAGSARIRRRDPRRTRTAGSPSNTSTSICAGGRRSSSASTRPNRSSSCAATTARRSAIDELYRFENQERSAFLGEQAITAAILDVASAGREKDLFPVGHEELRPDDVDPVRGACRALRELLRQRNFDVDELLQTCPRPARSRRTPRCWSRCNPRRAFPRRSRRCSGSTSPRATAG